jgi:hypothetical protein
MALTTLASLKSRVYDRLEGNSRFYQSAEIVAHINDAVRVVNLFTGFVESSATLLAQDQRLIYDAPPSILCLLKVTFDGRDLDPVTFGSLCHSSPRWMKETTRTNSSSVETWTPVGLRKFIIHPGPHTGGALVTITGVSEPTEMSENTDTLLITDEFQDLVVDHAAHVAMIKCGGAVATDAMFQYKKFLRRMKELSRFKGKVAPNFWIDVDKKVEA